MITAYLCHLLIVWEIHCVGLKCYLSFLSGSIGSSGYIPAFLKKEIGSAGQRIQLAPAVESPSSKYSTKVVSVSCSLLW